MSWSLFNHNLPTGQFDPAGYPDSETTVVGETTYSHGVEYASNAFGWHQMFDCGLNNDKIMISPVGYGYLWFSDDGGGTWTKKARPFYDLATYPIQTIRYDEARDTWWATPYRAETRQAYYYYSEDDGATWTEYFAATTGSYSHGMAIGDSGQLYYGQSGSNWRLYEYYNPKTSASQHYATSYFGSTSQWAVLFMGDTIVGTGGGQGQAANAMYFVDKEDFTNDQEYTYDTIVDGRVIATSNINGLVYRSNVAGLVTFDRIYPGVATGTLPTVSYDFGETVDEPIISFGDGVFMLTAIKTSDSTKLLVAIMNDSLQWQGTHTITLPVAQWIGGGAHKRQVEHCGGGEWIIAYLSALGVGGEFQVSKFKLGGEGQWIDSYKLELFKAIVRQNPDIYFRMDDELLATTVVDLGSKQYTNVTQGSLAFQSLGLITTDGGTSCLFDAVTDTGILVSAVPAPTNHAHFYVLDHDGTASVRVLASSGDADDPFNFSYYVFLAADHKLGVAVYNDGWEYSYSTAVIAADTTTICAVKIEDAGDVTFYIADAWDAIAEDVPITDLSATNLSVGGAWTGGTSLLSSADGVTVDYYALIPNEYFSYQDLVEANGGTYIGPPSPAGLKGGDLIFLVHGDDASLDGPYDVDGDGVNAWRLLNSVPGTDNHINTEVTAGRIDYTDSKFGAGSFVAPYKSSRDGMKPWDIAYWHEGHQRLNIGYQAFSYDVWFKSLWSNGFGYAGSSQGFYRRSGKWYRFGGITISVSQQPGNPTKGRISINVGTSLERAIAGDKDALDIHYINIPGYISGGFNHIAVCRSTGLSLGGPPIGTWNVLLNGNKATDFNVIERESQSFIYSNILKSGQWMFGSYMWQHPGYPASRYTPPAKFDEARLVVGGSGIYKESFTPPTAPYDYG